VAGCCAWPAQSAVEGPVPSSVEGPALSAVEGAVIKGKMRDIDNIKRMER
jgi:hypothetical protein